MGAGSSETTGDGGSRGERNTGRKPRLKTRQKNMKSQRRKLWDPVVGRIPRSCQILVFSGLRLWAKNWAAGYRGAVRLVAVWLRTSYRGEVMLVAVWSVLALTPVEELWSSSRCHRLLLAASAHYNSHQTLRSLEIIAQNKGSSPSP